MEPILHTIPGILIALIIYHHCKIREYIPQLKPYGLIIMGMFMGYFPDFDKNIHQLTNNPTWMHRSIYTHSIPGLIFWPALITILVFCIYYPLRRTGDRRILSVIYLTSLTSYASHLIIDHLNLIPIYLNLW